MPNTGVKGRIVYAGTTDDGVPDLDIVAVDLDPISGDDLLGKTKTDANGHFEISYTQNDYRLWHFGSDPDIVVRIYGPSQRLLHETSECTNVQKTIHDLGKIKIHKNNVGKIENEESWLVTNATLNPEDGMPIWLTQGNLIEPLIDGAQVFPKLTEAVKGAVASINLMNFKFSVNKNLITKFEENFIAANPRLGEKVEGERVHEILRDKAGTLSYVNVLVNDVPFLDEIPVFQICFKKLDSFDEVKNYFKGSKVNVRGSAYPILSLMHARAVVIDGKTAFVMGSSISQGYFNDKYHLIHDARHGGSLMHDVSIMVRGPAVEHIDRTITTVWKAAASSSSTLQPATGQSPVKEPDVAGVQVVRTMPGGTFTASHTEGVKGVPKATPGKKGGIPYGETGVLEAYQRAIARAKDFIYIEDQYFACPEIVSALIRRMKMKEASNLEVIIVLLMEPDIPGYPQEQIKRIRQLQHELGKENEDRLGIFTLWSCDETKTKFEIMPIYVHSKVAIIDDRWATVGSANLDGVSMNQLQLSLIAWDGIHSLFNFLPEFVFETLPNAVKSSAKWVTNLIPRTGSTSGDSSSSLHDKVWKAVRKVICIVGKPIGGMVAAVLAIVLIRQTKLDRAFTRSTQHANPKRSRQPPRFTELNLGIYNDVAGQPSTVVIAQLRKDLWREHLGYELDLPSSPKGLELWRRRAAEKLEEIKKGADKDVSIKDRKRHPAKILEWKPETDPEKYLRALGVKKTRNLKVRKYGEADEFDFNMGKWISE